MNAAAKIAQTIAGRAVCAALTAAALAFGVRVAISVR
jgi:hypothetical protein